MQDVNQHPTSLPSCAWADSMYHTILQTKCTRALFSLYAQHIWTKPRVLETIASQAAEGISLHRLYYFSNALKHFELHGRGWALGHGPWPVSACWREASLGVMWASVASREVRL